MPKISIEEAVQCKLVEITFHEIVNDEEFGSPYPLRVVKRVGELCALSDSVRLVDDRVAQIMQVRQNREAALNEIRRLLFAASLGSMIRYRRGSRVRRSREALAHDPWLVLDGKWGAHGVWWMSRYQQVVQWVSSVSSSMQSLRDSLTRLVQVDGVDAAIGAEVKAQGERAAQQFKMLRSAISTQGKQPMFTHTDGASFFNEAEEAVATALLTKAWSRCFVDPVFGFQVAISRLINELLAQGATCLQRIQAVIDLICSHADANASDLDWRPAEAHYRALLNKIQTES